MMMIYNALSSLEKEAVQKKKYAEFVMLLLYTMGFIHLIAMIMTMFGIEIGVMLSFPFLFALIYIQCKREPEGMSSIWGFRVQSNLYI
jgi:hypothetical protein